MDQHVPAGSVYPSDGGEATGNKAKITVLTSASGKRATKRFTSQGVEGYARESRWRWREAEIGTFDDLARLLSEIERDPLSLIVQGTVAPAWRDKEIIPRTKAKGEPSLIDGGSCVVHFDIDDLPLPLGTGWHDPDGVARAIWASVIIARVPAFDGASFYWQASSSAGTPGKEHLAKLHIWALLDQPIDEDQRKALLKLAGADHSLASINQPNYVAAPIFDGVPDPLAAVGRSGVVIGERDHAAVDLIAWPETKIRQAKARKPKASQGPVVMPEGLNHATTDEGRDLLDRACVKISTLSSGGRNNAINRIAYGIGGHVAGRSIAYEEAHSALLSAGLASGHDRYVEAVENGLRDGIQRPIAHEEPFHPAPDGDRDAAIAAHPATIRAWADRNIPIMQATKAVARAYAAAPGSPAACSLESATAAALERGLSVRVAVPDGAPGKDWNDVLQAAGADSVRAAIASTPVQTPASWGPATAAAPVGTVFDARRRMAEAFEAWAESALWYDPETAILPPPIVNVRVSTGVGKSYTARRAAVDLVRKLRAKDDPRAVVLAVPRHNLGDEYADALAKIAPDLVVESYRGRSAPDPEADDETMCRRADEAAAVQKAHGDVRSTLCRKGSDRCAFFDMCGHNRQRAAHADIWIVPHANLWRAKPAMIEPVALVIDEDPTQGAFGGFGAPVRLALDELAMRLTIRLDDAGTADLAELSGRVASALRAGGDRVSLAAIKAEGLTTDDLAEARRLAFKAKIAPDARPSTAAADLAERLAQIGPHNRQAVRRARLFGIIKEAIEAGLETVPGLVCETAKGKDGETFRAVRLRWRNDIATGWTVPTLIASATARPEVLRAIWPWLGDVIEADAASPFVSIRQITDRQFGAASLAPVEHAGSAAHAFARNTRRRMHRYIEARAAEIGGRVLVIAQQAVIDLLRAEGLPQGVATCHFNALSGLDQWRDVRLIIVIGRTMPAPAAVEDMTEVLSFSAIERVSGWYPVRAAHPDMRGTGEGPAIVTKRGKGAEATPGAPYHPDALAEAIRWQICEGELLQGMGRGRGVNRDANSPLQIDVLCNLPLPIAVDEAGAFETFEPSARDLMAARGFEVLDTSAKGAWAVVAAILPDVFPTPEAARKAMERSRGHNPISISIGICPRESGTGRVKLAGARYAVSVRIRARSEAEARDMLARVLPGAGLLEFVPPEPPVDLDANLLFQVGSVEVHPAERACIGSTVARVSVGDAMPALPVGAITGAGAVAAVGQSTATASTTIAGTATVAGQGAGRADRDCHARRRIV